MCSLRFIKTVQIPPEDCKRRRQSIYNYFGEKLLSPDYAKKLLD